jgi:hypothetical protein
VALKLESLAAGSGNIDPDMSRAILDLLEKVCDVPLFFYRIL